MRRVAVLAAALLAGAALPLSLVASSASALPVAAPRAALAHGLSDDVQLVRRGGGGFRGGHGFRGGGFRGHAFRGGGFRGFRGHGFRGGRHFGGWRGHRGWRGAGWGLAFGAPLYYGGYGYCPLVRRTVWTPRGYRVRWVRRCW